MGLSRSKLHPEYCRSPRLPIDLLFGLTTESGKADHRTYMERWRTEMQEAYYIVKENAKKSTDRSKRHYDGKVRSSVLHPGDRVLIRNLTPRGGTGKLRNHWEENIHVVVRQVGKDIPVYEVKPEQGRGRSRNIHRNLLLPCDHLPLEIQPQAACKQNKRKTQATTENTEQEDENDEEECLFYYQPVTQSDIPNVDRNLEHADTQNDSDIETPVLYDDRQVNEQDPPTNTHDSEIELENVLQDDNLDEQPVAEAQDEIQDEIQELQHPDSSDDDGELEHDLPKRDRRAPKIFTYDRLGTPSCYSTTHANEAYQCYPILYREVQPMTVWRNPYQVYQPLFMPGY
ncbi:uncharacterized protein LOC117825942 [Notolabrus celidotus]|uniref:uncharacterized protein LOC117825942 n=1 Tax=Notolabrus celidotus TaxID=1203425 RepID=UPI00148FBABA|nr:uncharacterized protein LOC117825942 [Notolabrus celidotus]